MKTTTLVVPLLAACLAGCVGDPAAMQAVSMSNSSMAKKGSPYRWVATPVSGGTAITKETLGTPAETRADATLKADILRAITELETKAGRPGEPQIKEVRFLDETSKKLREIWVLSVAEEKSFAYVVTMKTEKGGGTELSLTGPW